MPFEPPTVDSLEAFEPPSVDSLETEELKSPGFLGPAWPAQEGEEEPAPKPEPEAFPQEVLQSAPWSSRFRMSPFGRAVLGPTADERAGMAGEVSGSRIVPSEILDTAFKFATVPPPIAEPIKAVTQPLIEAQAKAQKVLYPWKLAELTKGVSEATRDLGLELPLAAGVVGMGKNIGRAMLGLFTGEFLISVPEQYEAFKAASEKGDWTDATKIVTKAIITGTLLGGGGVHEARGALAELAKAKREQGQLPPTTLGLARLKENLLNLVGRPSGVPIPETPEIPPLIIGPHVTPPAQKPEDAIIAKAEPILPQAAAAAKEATKGEITDAIEERNVQESVSGERAGDDALRTPAETSVSGGVQPAAPIAEAVTPARTAPGQSGLLLSDETKLKLRKIGWTSPDFADLEAGDLSVSQIVNRKLQPFEGGGGPDHAKALEEARIQAVADAEAILAEKPKPAFAELTPEQKFAEQRALDEALGQETTPTIMGKTATVDDFLSPQDKANLKSEQTLWEDSQDKLNAIERKRAAATPYEKIKLDEQARRIRAMQKKSAKRIDDISEKAKRAYEAYVSGRSTETEPSATVEKSTPPPESTPTVSQAAEPSLQTPATQGSIPQVSTPNVAAQPQENLLISPRTDGMVILQDTGRHTIGTFKNADEAGAWAKENGYGIAAGSPLKPNTATKALSSYGAETVNKLRLLGLTKKEITTLEKGTSVEDVITEKLPVDLTRGEDHAAANSEARQQAIKDVHLILESEPAFVPIGTEINGWEKTIRGWRKITDVGSLGTTANTRTAQKLESLARSQKPSSAAAPQQTTQAPFLDIPPEKWTPEYWKRIGDEGRRTVRSNLQGALQKLGSKTKITERSAPQAVFNAIAEVNKARTEPPPTAEPPTIALQAGLGIPGIEKLDRKFDEMRQGLATLMRAGPERRQMDQTFDATDNMANIVARQATNKLRLSGKPIELEAIYPFIESKGDINQLRHFIAQATGKNDTAVVAAKYALSHWNDPHFQALAARAKQISDAQINQEHAAGINTEYREAYLPHSYDRDLLMGFNRPFVIGGSGGGTRTGFKKGRTFETIYDAIEAGYPVKTLNAADTLESRIRSGQKLINRVAWADSLRSVVDPTDGLPIIESVQRHSRGPGKPDWESAPSGYVVREIIPGVRVAVHEGYTSLWRALTGESAISGSVPGKLLLEAEGAVKHGLLLFDTYHVSRVLQKEAFLAGATKMGWRKGLTLLEYSDADLNAALREGFITPEMANFARTNRANAELLVRSGLNVGRIQENLYNSVVRQIPVIGKFNKWVFEKMTRGAMLQSALIELERVQRDFGLNRQDAALKVARDLNVYFGNLGRQGLFKSATAQDLARIVALAPQWVEGMLRTEIGAVSKTVIDPIKYRKLAVSSLPLGVGTGLAAYFVATQIVNMVTRGHPTWENPEKGHKMDAWIPDFTGKTGGYFLSPFSVPAEITHDMIRYARTEPDTIATASRILSNKQSPLFRATKTLLTGKDWTGEKLIGSWERAKAASVNLVPAPIGVAPLVTGEKYPGQAQRQITASLGIKTEPAPTAIQQIREIKKEWGLNNPNPKIKHQFEQALKADYGKSDYDDLRRALSTDDTKKAGEAYDALIAMGKKPSDINDAVSWYTGGKENASGVYQERKIKPIGGQMSEAAESRFKSSLTPAQRKVYLQAIEERKRIYARFLELLETR